MTDLQKALDYAKLKKEKDLESAGGTKVLDGSLVVNESLKVKKSISTNNGSTLCLVAGESNAMYDNYITDFRTTEYVTTLSESGLQIITATGNWATEGGYTEADWAKKNIAVINDSRGNTTLPGGISINSSISGGEGSDSHLALYADAASDYAYTSYHRETGERAWEAGMMNDHDKWFLRGKDTNSTNARDLIIADYSENKVYMPEISADRIKLQGDGTSNYIELFSEKDTAPMSEVFSANTSKNKIYFHPTAGNSDPGFIVHETNATQNNDSVLHLCPGDDNGNLDRVVIHGHNDPEIIKLHTTGDAWFRGTITEASDERIKENIETIESPLEKIQALRGVSYNKKDNPDNLEIGFIAQEVEKVVPELVKTEDDMKSVSYARTVALLVEGMKEQQKQIEILTTRIKVLEGEK